VVQATLDFYTDWDLKCQMYKAHIYHLMNCVNVFTKVAQERAAIFGWNS
jgi:hypothetical protein